MKIKQKIDEYLEKLKNLTHLLVKVKKSVMLRH